MYIEIKYTMNRIVLTALADCIDDPVKINELFKIQLRNNRNLRKTRMELEENNKLQSEMISLLEEDDNPKLSKQNLKIKELKGVIRRAKSNYSS